MSYTFRIDTEAARERVIDFIRRVPLGVIATVKQEKRSTEQNARFWAMLTDLSNQCEIAGGKYSPDVWKFMVMHAYGHEVQMLPSLNGKGFVPINYRSSHLSVGEMTDLMEWMAAYGAENGVQWSNEEQAA